MYATIITLLVKWYKGEIGNISILDDNDDFLRELSRAVIGWITVQRTGIRPQPGSD